MLLRPGTLNRRSSPGTAQDIIIAATQPISLFVPAVRSSVLVEISGATTVASVDGPVGTILDLTGGRHLTAPTDADRPTLRESGGLVWLEFAVEHTLVFASAFPTSMTALVAALSTSDANGILVSHGGAGSTGAPFMPQWFAGQSGAPVTLFGSPTTQVDRVTAATNGALSTALADASSHVLTISGGTLASSPSGPVLNGYNTDAAAFRWAGNLYGLALAGPDAAELAALEDYMAALSGATLP